MSINYDPFNLLNELRGQVLSGGRTPSSFPMDAYRRGDDFVVHPRSAGRPVQDD